MLFHCRQKLIVTGNMIPLNMGDNVTENDFTPIASACTNHADALGGETTVGSYNGYAFNAKLSKPAVRRSLDA